MIQAGKVRARARDFGTIRSPEKGTPGFRATFELLDGPDKGQSIDWTTWVSDKTESRVAETLSAMGFDGTNPDSACGKDVVLAIEHEEFTGRDGTTHKTPRVKWVNAIGGAARFETLSPSETSNLYARMRTLMQASKKNSKTDDDVKF